MPVTSMIDGGPCPTMITLDHAARLNMIGIGERTVKKLGVAVSVINFQNILFNGNVFGTGNKVIISNRLFPKSMHW